MVEEQLRDPKLFPRWLIFFRPVDRDRENKDADSVVKTVSRKLTEQTRKIEAAQVGQLNAHRHWQGEAEAGRQEDVDKQLDQLRDQQDQVQAQQVQIKEQQDNMQKEIKEQQAQMQAELEKLVRVVGAALKPWVQKPEPEPEPEPESSK